MNYMVISAKYSRYRSLSYCIYCDIRDDVRRAIRKLINALKGKKEEKKPPRKNDGYRRWWKTEWGGGEV